MKGEWTSPVSAATVVPLIQLVCVFVCRYQGHIGSSLIVGGVDVAGAHLYSVYPHGSYDKLPYLAMGTSARQHLAGVSTFSCLSVRLVPLSRNANYKYAIKKP